MPRSIKKEVVRKMLRLLVPHDKDSLDAKLIDHLNQLELDSSHRVQEWMRTAMRNQLERELLIQEKTNTRGLVNEA